MPTRKNRCSRGPRATGLLRNNARERESQRVRKGCSRGARPTSMVASGPGKLLLERESRGERQESSQTLGKPAFNAKRRELKLSAFAVYQCVGQFRGQKISSPTRTRTLDLAVNSRSLYQLSYRGRGHFLKPYRIGRLPARRVLKSRF